MNKVTVKIDGMMCGMCESHVLEVSIEEYEKKGLFGSRKGNKR